MDKLKIIILGSTGKMGQTLIKQLVSDKSFELVGAHEIKNCSHLGKDAGYFIGIETGILISNDLTDNFHLADVIIDFTRPEATLNMLNFAVQHKIAYVVGTTGFNNDEISQIQSASKYIPICMAPNMSVGINVLISLVEKAAKFLPDYDFEIIESHHKHKVDSPSGTALRLGQAAAEGLKISLVDHAVYTRHGRDEQRGKSEIGFSTIRAGDIVGEHTVMIAGDGERIELTHKATNRGNFAAGALKAATFLVDKTSGIFDMQDVLGLK